ncbi:MAG: hypothetical protein O2904_00095 [bacterium]|nr:hypothetical protein [bacterium]
MITSLLIAYSLHHFAIPVLRGTELSQPSGSNLTVELRQTAGRSFAPGSQRVPMLSLTLDASCHADVPIHTIEVRRRGFGSSNDVLSVYAMSGNQRLTRGRQVSRKGYAQLNLRSFVVAACSSETIDIFADFSPDASLSGEHTFIIESPDDIETSGAYVHLRRGAQHDIQQRTVGTRQGNITVSYPKVLQRIRYGADRVVMRLGIEADGADDHRVTAVTITNNGSARDADLSGLYLEAGTRRVTNIVSQLQNNRVRLVFSPPFFLKKNQAKTLTLRADVRASRSRTIQLLLEEPGDIESEVLKGRRSD